MSDGGQEEEKATRREFLGGVGKVAAGVVIGAAVEHKIGFWDKFLRRIFSGEKDTVAEDYKKDLKERGEHDTAKRLSGTDQAQIDKEHELAKLANTPGEGNPQSVVDMNPKEGIITPGSSPTSVKPDEK